eukprot:UN22453
MALPNIVVKTTKSVFLVSLMWETVFLVLLKQLRAVPFSKECDVRITDVSVDCHNLLPKRFKNVFRVPLVLR